MATARDYTEKTTFSILLDENKNDYKAVEAKLIKDLAKYSESDFSASKWVQEIEGKAVPRETHFGGFKNIDEQFLNTIRLWAILRSNALGNLDKTADSFSSFTNYLASKKLNLKQVRVSDLKDYEEHLDTSIGKRTNKPLGNATKWENYHAVLSFFTLMQGHPLVAKIENIGLFVNPYVGKIRMGSSNEDGNKEIPKDKLDILDSHFKQESVPLAVRVYYWLMRMYGVRPEDALSYPLDCVKLLNDDTATMKTYVGKQNTAVNRIDVTEEQPYKIVLLNLKEPMQKMLYRLIKEQQNIAEFLQNEIDKKNFLMTKKKDGHLSEITHLLTKEGMKTYWKREVKILFSEGETPNMKSLKHTAISKRAYWGTHTHHALRDVANHQSHHTLDAYTKPAPENMIALQKRIEAFLAGADVDWAFKGTSVINMKNILTKIMENPFAHQLPGKGFCPDARSCGNHFECIGCNYLVPHPELRDYYLKQAEDYDQRAQNLEAIGKNHEADDRMVVATKFFSLYQRTFDEELKELEGFEMIDLKEIMNYA